MSVAQVGSLISFVDATTIVHSDFNSNFTDLRTAFNNLVTGADQLAGGITVNGALTVSSLLVSSDNGGALGASGTAFSDLFLASGSVINFNAGAETLTHAANKLTLGGGDFHIANGNGMVVGHTAQVTIKALVPELQILGTSLADATLVVGRWTNGTGSPEILLYKSRNTTIGSNTAVTTGDNLGQIIALGDDGTDADTISSAILFDSEGSIATGQVPGIIKLQTAAAGSLADVLTLDSAKLAAFAGAVTIATTATVAGILSVDDTTDTTSTTSGSIHTDGGLGVALDLWVGVKAHIIGEAEVTSYVQGTTGNGYLQMRGDSGASVDLRYTDAGLLLLGVTSNANMTQGLTLFQGSAANEILACKNSGVTHARTGIAETATYGTLSIAGATYGGILMRGISEDNVNAPIVLLLEAYGGQAGTSKTSAANALITLYAEEHDGSNNVADVSADGNVLCVQGRVGSATRALFIVDEDGDLYADGTTGTGATVGLFDDQPDALLCRGFDLARGRPEEIVQTRWDEFVGDREQELVELGILGDTIANDGLVNITQLQRLHNGAIWQAHVERQEMKELIVSQLSRIEKLERKLLVA